MTHDELLAKIDIWKFQTKGYDDAYEVHGVLNALRAVVELHKPCCDLEELCNECNPNVPYPCPTIEAIEKELG